MHIHKVCVIIPCFNAERYLVQTLNSVLSQSYKNVSIVAVDDGSTDNTNVILKSYSGRIAVLTHDDKKNHGAHASMNLGLLHSNSEYVAFLDSDDIFYQCKIEKQVEILENNPEIDVVYTNGHAISSDDKILYNLFDEKFIEENVPGRMLLDCYISAGSSSIMVRRNLLEKVGFFNEKFPYAKDHDMWIRMSEVSKFYYISECLMAYRIHSGQQSIRRDQWEDGFLVLEQACERYPYSIALKRKRLAVIYYRLGLHDYKSGNIPSSFFNFILAFFYDPTRALIHLSKQIF